MGYPSAKYRVQLMPLKLKQVLLRHSISQTDLAHAVVQSHGVAMNKTSVNLLINWGTWPKTTPKSSVIEQVNAYLLVRGVPEAEIATVFDLDEHMPLLTPGRPAGHLAVVSEDTPPVAKATDEDYLLLEPVMLKQAAKRHFKITFDPFGMEPQSAADVYFGEEQRFVAAALREAIDNTRMVALVGESGSGKSTLWDWITDQIASQAQPIHLIKPQITDKERITGRGILQAIVRDLDPTATCRQDSEALARQAYQLLAERVAEGQRCVLIFEEGHDLNVLAIKQLKRFHEMKAGYRRFLSIILLAQPELMRKLNRVGGEAREVKNRMEIIRMLPLDNDLEAYIAHRLERGSIKPEAIFEPGAFDAIRQVLCGISADKKPVSMCYPLLVGNLVTRAMNIAAELGAPKVDARIVADAKKRED